MYLYGASGHAKVVIDIVHSNGGDVNGLFDDNLSCTSLKGVQYLGSLSSYSNKVDGLIISIGNNRIRQKLANSLQNIYFGTAIHSSAIISDDVIIGNGTVVMQGAIVQASARIGMHCIINTAASVDHDCAIEDFVHISPNATLCGNVSVGEGSQVGAGAVVIPGKRVGKWALVAAGAVVIRDVPDYALVVGNPARILKYLK